jgi:hypothetical protein
MMERPTQTMPRANDQFIAQFGHPLVNELFTFSHHFYNVNRKVISRWEIRELSAEGSWHPCSQH